VGMIKAGESGDKFERYYASIVNKDQNLPVILETMAMLGTFFSSSVARPALEEAVARATIIPRESSTAVQEARKELAQAMLARSHEAAHGDESELTSAEAAIQRFSGNPNLTRLERVFGLRSLVYTAGLTAKVLNIELLVKA
jgi:hypothetical protein